MSDSYYHPSMYDVYKQERGKVKYEMSKLLIPKFSFESYKKTSDEKMWLKQEKINAKDANQFEKQELFAQIINSPSPNWGEISIFI